MVWHHLCTPRWRGLIVLLCSILLGPVAQATEPCPPPQLNADGDILPEVEQALDVDFSGQRDLLEVLGRIGIVKFQLDDINDGATNAGPDGFRDAGLRCPNVPHPDGGCLADEQCADMEFPQGVPSIRSTLNSGKLTIIYLPDTDGVVDPADPEGTDDSVLYVAIDIFNGFPFPPSNIIGNDSDPGAEECVNWHRVDFFDTDLAGDICEDGIRDLDGDLVPDIFGVPFDVDADGQTRVVSRWDGLGPDCVPGEGCDGEPSAPVETSLEEYRLVLNACTDPENPFVDNRVSGDCVLEFAIRALPNGSVDLDFIPTLCVNPVSVDPNWILSFPQAGTMDTDLDNDPRDVEFIVCHIESVVDEFYDSDYQIDRLRLAQGGVETRSDSNGDSAAEDAIRSSWFLPLPTIEVTKQVRCVEPGDPGAPNEWREHAEALPGSQVEFKLDIENTGNVPLDVTLTDVLESFADADVSVVPNFIQATYFPREGGSEVIVWPANVPDGLNVNFFAPAVNAQSFLGGVDTGNDRNLGTLDGLDVCNDILAGDRLEIIFRATVDAPLECNGEVDVDAQNAITAVGIYTDGDGNEFPTDDLAFDIDTYRENNVNDPPADNNVVTVDLLCRQVEFEKTVALCDDCGDPDGCDEFVDNLTIPAGAFGEPEEPICIRYRYQVFNYGEVDEEVLIADDLLCDDVNNTAGVSFVPGECEVCPNGVTVTVPKAVGGNPGVATAYCMIQIDTEAALAAFLITDNDTPACPDEVPVGVDDEYCYSNCATATANVTNLGDICDGVDAIELVDDTTICWVECELTVTKQVVCLTECGPNGELIGDYESTIEVIPGSCVRFKIEIENTSDPQFSDSCGACELTLTDEMATQPGQITFQDNVVFTLYRNGNPITCSTPAGFNVNGTPFDWDPGACGGTEYFEIGDVLEITFDARIPDTADPALDASNAVTQLNGTTPCEPPPNCCGPAFTVVGLPEAFVTLDILPFDIECTKEWSVLWDADADCEPGPDPEGYIDYSNNIDLGTADGGEAIVFPAILCQRVTVDNVGDVDANVTLTEQDLINAVNTTPGVSFVDEDACEIGDTKLVTAGDSETWECCIRVETAAAMRALAANDGGTNSGIFETKAEVSGEPTGVCPGNGDEAECEAEITPPPECSLNVTKEVFCIECPNGNIIDPPPGGDTMEAAPNACVRFVVTVQNTSGTVKIPRIKVDDLMTPNLGFTACSALLGATDATTCICDQGFNTNGVQREFTFGACRPFPGNPWISPGEALTISFDLTLGEVDILNEVTVEAYAEACAPPPPLEDESCAEADAEAEVEVLLPEIDCDKTISVDNNDDGSIEYGPSSSILLDDTTVSFPMRLIYTYTVYNTGDVPLTNVVLCDDTLVNQALMAGATVGPCDLCTGACDGTNDTCLTLPDIPLSGSETATCEILIPDEAALIAFVGGEGETYENIAVVTADGDYTGTEVCDSGPGPDPLETECDARITYNPEGCPSTKAKFWIWNENEVLFSGTERCVIAWDERYLSQWTIGAIPGAPDPPNNFLNTWLQTNLGHARLDGMESTLCPDSVDMPILAVLSQVIEFGGEPPQYAYSGANVQGAGQEAGQLTMLDLEDPMPANLDDGEQAGEPLGGDDRELPVSGGNAELPSLPDPPPAPDRVDATTKGSLLVFPKIELKWDAQGNLIQDTFITLNNDFTSGVQIKLFFVAHPLDPEVDCQFWVDNDIMLTENEPTYWSVRTGLPKGVSPFTVISDAMHPDPDPRNPGGLRMHGWVVAWAVDGNFQEIRWNHLYGGATIVRYDHGDAWEYSAAAFRGLIGDETGDLLLEPYGQLDLDGDEYDWMPSMLVFDFYAPDAVLISKDGRQIRVLDSDLAIWLGINNLTD